MRLTYFLLPLALAACGGEDATTPVIDMSGDTPDAATFQAAVAGAAWGDNVTVTIDGDDIVIVSDGYPNHAVLDAYAVPNGGTAAPATVATTITIPLVPERASAATETSLGSIGIAVSGAVFFNPYEGDGTSVALESNFSDAEGNPFLDDCNGHPAPMDGQYHYHGVPTCITATIDVPGEHSAIVGYLLDGHPIYGPQDEGGEAPSNLDDCLGHFGPTPEFPEGVYHYHTSTTAPYISPCYAGAVDAVMGMPGGPPPM